MVQNVTREPQEPVEPYLVSSLSAGAPESQATRNGQRVRVFHAVPNYDAGGHRSRIAILAAGLGFEFSHRVLSLDGGAGASRVEPGIHFVPFKVAPSHGVHLGNLVRLRRVLIRYAPHVLITYNWGAIEAAMAGRFAGITGHLHCEDGFSGREAVGGEPLRRALCRRIVLDRSRLVVPSQGLAQLAGDRWGMPPDRIELIPNGVDTARYARARPRATGQRSVIIGMLGRLSPEKNVGLALRAFARLRRAKDIQLVIAGEGPERPRLQAEAEGLGLAERTRFLGHVSDAAGFLGDVDIFALTSTTEQLPFSLLEAMAAGLPVVATDVGDVSEALAPANRKFVVSSGDESAFIQRLSLMVGSVQLRTALGEANAERARLRFDQRLMIGSYRRLLEEIVRPRLSGGT